MRFKGLSLGRGNPLRALRNLATGRPVMAVFEVCLRCNSRCGYCDLPLNRGRYELSRDEIRTLFTELHRDGLRFIFVQGGEPLVRKDVLDVLEDLRDIGFGLCLVTNGTKLSETIIARLADLEVAISVSLDTLDRERYRRIRGADQLEQVLAGLHRLEGYPWPKFIACIVSEENRDDVEAVCRFANAHGFAPIVGAYHWEIGRYGKVDPTLTYARERAAVTFEMLLKRGLLPSGFYTDYAKSNIQWLRGEKLPRCDAARHSIAIDASGNVAACLAQPSAGNLREHSLREILAAMNHEASRRARSQVPATCCAVVWSGALFGIRGAACAHRCVWRGRTALDGHRIDLKRQESA
ncbi:MAG: radical SAM protein [Myxococcota bacterium]